MRKVWLGVVLLALRGLPTLGEEKEQDRVENAGKVMEEILNIPDDIPQSVIDKADCVVVLPSVLKFAIGIGGSYGRGVMTCRRGRTFRGLWGAPTMMALEGGSFGLQLGGQATDFVLLLMSPRSADNILTSKVKLGGDASAAAGPVEGAKAQRPKLFLSLYILGRSALLRPSLAIDALRFGSICVRLRLGSSHSPGTSSGRAVFPGSRWHY